MNYSTITIIVNLRYMKNVTSSSESHPRGVGSSCRSMDKSIVGLDPPQSGREGDLSTPQRYRECISLCKIG